MRPRSGAQKRKIRRTNELRDNLLFTTGESDFNDTITTVINMNQKRINPDCIVPELHDGATLQKLCEKAIEDASKDLNSEYLVHEVCQHGFTRRALGSMKKAAPKVCFLVFSQWHVLTIVFDRR